MRQAEKSAGAGERLHGHVRLLRGCARRNRAARARGGRMIGRPRFFDIDIYLSVVEGMINADEVERAFWMLKNPPAYYRKYPPKRLLEIKERLHRQVWTPVQYKGIYEGAKI